MAVCQQHQQHDYMPAMLPRHCASILINIWIIRMIQMIIQHSYVPATPATWLHVSHASPSLRILLDQQYNHSNGPATWLHTSNMATHQQHTHQQHTHQQHTHQQHGYMPATSATWLHAKQYGLIILIILILSATMGWDIPRISRTHTSWKIWDLPPPIGKK